MIMMNDSKITRSYGGKGRVLQFLRENPGNVVTTGEVAEMLGMPASTTSGALSDLARDPASGVEIMSRGAYVYRSASRRQPVASAAPTALVTDSETFHRVQGITPDGEILVRGDDEILYVLRPLKVVR